MAWYTSKAPMEARALRPMKATAQQAQPKPTSMATMCEAS